MKKLLIIALLVVGCEKDTVAPNPFTCDGLTEVELWGECYTITFTTYLNLSEMGLSGEIPSCIGDLTNLNFIHLEYNQLSGEIPVEIGNLVNLTSLDLSHNQLTGEIPSFICKKRLNRPSKIPPRSNTPPILWK